MKIIQSIVIATILSMFSGCVTETFMIENSTWKTCTVRCAERNLKYLGYRVSYSYVYFQVSVEDIICECFDNYRYMMSPRGFYDGNKEDY